MTASRCGASVSVEPPCWWRDVDLESRRFHLFEYSADKDHFFDEIEALAAVLNRFERA